ncbi:MAG: adenylate/guanylate cyclase domain-containing protein [Mesorhizobium sp.]|nr:MAG: adenylate/guanylate cyclase domain-containing protein [Mesorhizobium sp.]
MCGRHPAAAGGAQRRHARGPRDPTADRVNLGDVIVEGEDIFGDGVNIAARLESVAPAGGIAVSGTVRDHLGNRLDLQFEDMGEQALKNIEQLVRVCRVRLAVTSALVRRALSLPDKPWIAVLPFVNMSGDPEQEYFSDGITEDIITELSRFRSLSVIARNSSSSRRESSAHHRAAHRR